MDPDIIKQLEENLAAVAITVDRLQASIQELRQELQNKLPKPKALSPEEVRIRAALRDREEAGIGARD